MLVTRNKRLRNKRRLAKGEMTMCVGSVSKVDVIVVGPLPLHLPSGLVLDLNNCYLVPTLSMNIISDLVYCETVIHLKRRIMVVLFI